jgi:hypothetical protein
MKTLNDEAIIYKFFKLDDLFFENSLGLNLFNVIRMKKLF